jgi:inner membrane protein
MGVRFVDPANPYQQSMRSAKYGILIIILVFVAGLVVEFLTKKEINPVQYAVIGLSLVLFYSLLLSFSEFMMFGVAYIIAALMTTGALVFYFRAILKSRSAYMLGGFVALVYMLNYMLLQMETYALLAGSLVLFLLLCVVMYLTADMSKNKELPKAE